MRAPLVLLALLLVPAASAQAPDSSAAPRLVEVQPTPVVDRESGPTLAASGLGALGGFVAGAGVSYAVTRPSIFDDLRPVAFSAFGGMALGAATAASLHSEKRFLPVLGGAVLGEAVGFGLGFLIYRATGSDVGYLATPVGAVVGAEWSTR